MAKRARNPTVAGVLSALLPGLGQFYNRQWGKGAGFLVGLLVLDGVLGATSDMLAFVTDGRLPGSPARFLVGTVLILALAIGSIVDAVRVAKRAGSREAT